MVNSVHLGLLTVVSVNNFFGLQFLQKIIIIACALFVAVSCDVSHIVNADGWYKDGSGYHYDKPEVRFDTPEEVPPQSIESLPELEDEVTDEPTVEVSTEVTNEYLPPASENREYLPPRVEEAKRKRQVQGRKVYRRFVRKH